MILPLLLLAPPDVAILDLTGLKSGALTRAGSWDELQAATALQGIVNRKEPQLYVHFVGPEAKLDKYWQNRLDQTWMKGWTHSTVPDLWAAISGFKSSIKGLVVWDEQVPATANVAMTAAGVEDLLPVRFDRSIGSLYMRLTRQMHLPVREWLIHEDGTAMFTGSGTIPGTKERSTGSAKNDAYVWAIDHYLVPGKCQPGWMGYYPDATWIATPHEIPLERTLVENQDFFVSKRGFIFDLSPWEDERPDDDPLQPLGTDSTTLKRILKREYELNRGHMTQVSGFTPWDQKYTDFTGRKHGGVATEWHYAEILSSFNAFMDADAPGLHAMANASVFTHEPMHPRYVQHNLPSDHDLMHRGYLTDSGKLIPKAYVSIYVGDYDSAAWMYTRLPDIWNDPARGTIPLGWAFNPALEARFPTGLTMTRDTATRNDFFISGDSGAGYLNPGGLQAPRKYSGLPSGVHEWARFCAPLYSKWDLGITGFVIDGDAPAMDEGTLRAYSEISRKGLIAQKVPLHGIVEDMPILRMGADLPSGDIPTAAHTVAAGVADPGKASFSIYRTILWSPSDHKRLFDEIHRLRPDVQIVDPYTLMRLLALSQKRSKSPGDL